MKIQVAETIQRFIIDTVTPELSYKGYSIYAINDKFSAFHREEYQYLHTSDTLDEALDLLIKHIHKE